MNFSTSNKPKNIKKASNKKSENTEFLKTRNENLSKLLLKVEWFVGILAVLILLSGTTVAAYANISDVWKVLIVIVSFLLSIPPLGFAILIEKEAGYYECSHCHHKYIPTWQQVLWSPHFGRTRKMKCPSCGAKTWNKKKTNNK